MINVAITQFTVCYLPIDHSESWHWLVTVARRGEGSWAVCRDGDCLGSDGTWSYEPTPSSRTEEWLASHRFDRDIALQMAKDISPTIEVNGMTAVEFAKKMGLK